MSKMRPPTTVALSVTLTQYMSAFWKYRPWMQITRSRWETTLHDMVAAILHTPRDSRKLHVCPSVMIGEYPVRTWLVC